MLIWRICDLEINFFLLFNTFAYEFFVEVFVLAFMQNEQNEQH